MIQIDKFLYSLIKKLIRQLILDVIEFEGTFLPFGSNRRLALVYRRLQKYLSCQQ